MVRTTPDHSSARRTRGTLPFWLATIASCWPTSIVVAFGTTTIASSGQSRISSSPPPLTTPTCPSRGRNGFIPTTVARQGFLDGLFVGGGEEPDKADGAVLATYDLTTAEDGFESLSDYLTRKWIGLFEAGTISLTTPVSVSGSFNSTIATNGSPSTVEDIAGCQLLFESTDTGYRSKDEEDDDGDDGVPTKKKAARQGGVEILVQKLSSPDPSLRVVARRCAIDEGTLIKEMSEEIILKEMAKAIDVWKTGPPS